MGLDFDKIKQAAEGYRTDMTAFLRAMISHPSESCEEKEVVACIKAEMEKLNFDKVEVDGLGNVIGWMGEGDKIIAIDSHIDTVGIGNINNWEADPYEGYETDEIIYGRGGSDQEGGMASAVYGAKIMKDLNLIPEGYKIMIVGSVQEEDCDGMCWQYIYNKDKIVPEFVISTEPTDGGIYRGHRGRMEIRVDVKGVSCHGSAPERGSNAIYKMADIIADVRSLNNNGCDEDTDIKGLVKMLSPKYNPEHYEDAQFLGRGTCTVSQIFYTSPSRCAVADSCASYKIIFVGDLVRSVSLALSTRAKAYARNTVTALDSNTVGGEGPLIDQRTVTKLFGGVRSHTMIAKQSYMRVVQSLYVSCVLFVDPGREVALGLINFAGP